MLVGQSGVGKSSLVNVLLPNLDARVGALSAGSGKGRHTTSATTLYPLPGPGGTLLDSPGVWEFGLPDMEVDELLMGFAEMRPLIGHCHFSNCRHQQEPKCAILAAVEEGKISSERLQSFYALREAITTS
jgi:ribosome biogenesis GTPase